MRQARTNKKRKLNRFAIVLDSLMAIHNFSEAGFLWLKGLARPAGRMLEGRLTCPEPRSVCTKSRVEFDVAVRHGQVLGACQRRGFRTFYFSISTNGYNAKRHLHAWAASFRGRSGRTTSLARAPTPFTKSTGSSK